MRLHSPREISEAEPLAIERGLQTFRGAVSIVGETDNAAISELRIMWSDPLAQSVVPKRLEPLSLSIAAPGVLGYGYGHVPLLLNAMRTNILIVGAPGSGKSSALWAMIDWLSCCRDVVLHGIDLSGGPVLSAWGDVFADTADNRDDAERILRAAISRAIARTRVLAERSRPRAGVTAPASENWTPDDGMFHILIVDELPLLSTDQVLRELYAEHQRIGRKAGDTSIAAAQDLTKDTLGITSLRKYPSTLIMFACSRDDVSNALGGGKIREGWTPHRLVAAEGDAINDAGKCFIKSGRHTRPVPWRFARLDDIGEIHSRALERIDAGRPVDTDPVSAIVVPEPIASISAVFNARGNPPFLPTELILADMVAAGRDGLDAGKLAAELAPFGIEPDRKRFEGKLARGYALATVQTAENRLT